MTELEAYDSEHFDNPGHQKVDCAVVTLLSISGMLRGMIERGADPQEYDALSTNLSLIRIVQDELREINNHFNVASPTRVVDLRRLA